MKQALWAICLGLVTASPALATDFVAVRDKGAFLELLQGRALHIGIYNLVLNVAPDGQIYGSALGWDIDGTWTWQDGYFCREMNWSGTEIPLNCQLVEVRGTEKMRFTVDRGVGRSAAFNLR